MLIVNEQKCIVISHQCTTIRCSTPHCVIFCLVVPLPFVVHLTVTCRFQETMNPRDIMTDAIHNFHPQYSQYTQYSAGTYPEYIFGQPEHPVQRRYVLLDTSGYTLGYTYTPQIISSTVQVWARFCSTSIRRSLWHTWVYPG